jgi:hypothetical protein
MKDIILKWLEVKKIKYEKLYCKHEWEKECSWNTTHMDTGARKEDAITLYICKKCGEMKKVEIV